MSNRIKRDISKDKKGIEGLPMKLVIVALVAAAAIGIIFTWMSPLGNGTGNLDKIKITNDENEKIKKEKSSEITLKAVSTKDEGMEDIRIELTGCGVDKLGKTGEDGTKTFTITPSKTGFIEIKATDPENEVTAKNEIIVSE